VIDSPCPTCKGTGVARVDKAIEVTIPAGVDSGMKVRITGQGDAGKHGGAPGDLYLLITVQPDTRFERRGNLLYHTVRIPPSKAVLGTSVEVPLLEGGTETVTIPAAASTARRCACGARGPKPLESVAGETMSSVSKLVFPRP